MEPTPAEQRELERVGAFSDGVFAIAITLLVLNIEAPDVPGDDLGHALSNLSGDLVTYAIGFAVMGLFWYFHHKLFSRLARSSGRLMVVNLALLALIALMPFTTGVLGRYDEPVAVALYAANVGFAMLLDGLFEVVAIKDDLLAEPARRSPRETMSAESADHRREEGEARLTEPGWRGLGQGVGRMPTRATKKTRRWPLEEPLSPASRFEIGGGPFTSWPRSLRQPPRLHRT